MVRTMGTSSAPQVRQSTVLGFAGAGERKMDANSEFGFASFVEGAAVLTVSRLDKDGLGIAGFACEVEVLRSSVGLTLALLELSRSVETLLGRFKSFEAASPRSRRTL